MEPIQLYQEIKDWSMILIPVIVPLWFTYWFTYRRVNAKKPESSAKDQTSATNN